MVTKSKLLLLSSLVILPVSGNAPDSSAFTLALSYDDVLLVLQKTSVHTRKEVSTRTRFTKNISINIPIASANMDTVTESEMAISMAQLGGIGIIHRYNTIAQQVQEVERVKRYRNAVIQHPFTVSDTATIGDAREIMAQQGISSLLVIDDTKELAGILTARDLRFQDDNSVLVSSCMTPRAHLVTASAQVSLPEVKELFKKYRVEKLPLVDAAGKLAGLITCKDVFQKMEYPYASVDSHDRLLVGAAIGVKDDSLERAAALVKAGVDVLVIDIAHGHSDVAIEMVKTIKKIFPQVDVIAGNVATAEGTRDLIDAGADAIKVGVGPGSICTTRVVTGCGYPQFSAVLECARVADLYDIPVIADGGIKYSGDITKAIGAGASSIMAGRILSGTDESPGQAFVKNGKKFKVIRGMASLGAHLGRDAKHNVKKDAVDIVPEGVEGIVPYQGSVTEVLNQLIGGLRSGMSYCGATTIEQFRGKAKFVYMTSSGLRESHSHDVTTN